MWHQRLLPYPLLSKTTNDYPLSGFNCQVRNSALSNGEVINLSLEYQLNCESLQSLIEQRQADYAVQMTCVRTYNRQLHTAGQNRLQYLSLPADNYAHEIIATPYVVATEPVYGFTSPDHAAEIRELKPDGFDLPRGAILAVSDSIRVAISDTSLYSAIDLVANIDTHRGHYDIDLTTDRIKLYVNPTDKPLLERIRNQQPNQTGRTALTAAFYMNVIIQALHQMDEYPESKWAQAIRIALERHQIDANSEVIRRNAPRYAQLILEAPLGRLLASLVDATDSE